MTEKERLKRIRQILEEDLIPILETKGHDYSGNDVLSNLRDFGWQGIVVRLGDKYHRLANFCKQKELKVVDETIVDTFRDLINYGFIGLLLYEENK